MGIDIQKECQECCRLACKEENELKKEHSQILRGANRINRGEINQNEVENDLTFINDNPNIATLIIINPKFYEKMNKGERIHQILEPLSSFLNKNLFEIVNQLLTKIIELQRGSSFKNNVYVIFEKIYKDLINKKIIENMIKSDLGYFSKIKYNLLYVIEIIAELYHYFNYHLRNENHPYNMNYWEYIKNPSSYMKNKIQDMQKSIEEMNNFIIEKKFSNCNNSLDIHISAGNFNIQMEQ